MGERRREPLTKFPGGGGAERAAGGAGERASGRAGAGDAQRRLRAAPVRIAPPPPPGPSVRPALERTAGPGDSPSCCRQSAAAISPSQRHATARPGTLAQPGIRGAWQPHALPGAGAAFQKPRNRGLRLFRPSKGPRPSHVCTAEKLVTDRTWAPGKGGVRNAGPALLLKSFNALYLCDWKRYRAPERKVSTSAKLSSSSWLLGLQYHPFQCPYLWREVTIW